MKNGWLLALAVVLTVVPGVAGAAPQGKVVIAQGVDPSTLDKMNQQETPATVVAAHIYDTLVERDQSLKLVPALAASLPKLVAPTTWETAQDRRQVPQRRRVQRGRSSQPRAMVIRACGAVEFADRARGDRRRHDRARAHEQAVADSSTR